MKPELGLNGHNPNQPVTTPPLLPQAGDRAVRLREGSVHLPLPQDQSATSAYPVQGRQVRATGDDGATRVEAVGTATTSVSVSEEQAVSPDKALNFVEKRIRAFFAPKLRDTLPKSIGELDRLESQQRQTKQQIAGLKKEISTLQTKSRKATGEERSVIQHKLDQAKLEQQTLEAKQKQQSADITKAKEQRLAFADSILLLLLNLRRIKKHQVSAPAIPLQQCPIQTPYGAVVIRDLLIKPSAISYEQNGSEHTLKLQCGTINGHLDLPIKDRIASKGDITASDVTLELTGELAKQIGQYLNCSQPRLGIELAELGSLLAKLFAQPDKLSNNHGQFTVQCSDIKVNVDDADLGLIDPLMEQSNQPSVMDNLPLPINFKVKQADIQSKGSVQLAAKLTDTSLSLNPAQISQEGQQRTPSSQFKTRLNNLAINQPLALIKQGQQRYQSASILHKLPAAISQHLHQHALLEQLPNEVSSLLNLTADTLEVNHQHKLQRDLQAQPSAWISTKADSHTHFAIDKVTFLHQGKIEAQGELGQLKLNLDSSAKASTQELQILKADEQDRHQHALNLSFKCNTPPLNSLKIQGSGQLKVHNSLYLNHTEAEDSEKENTRLDIHGAEISTSTPLAVTTPYAGIRFAKPLHGESSKLSLEQSKSRKQHDWKLEVGQGALKGEDSDAHFYLGRDHNHHIRVNGEQRINHLKLQQDSAANGHNFAPAQHAIAVDQLTLNQVGLDNHKLQRLELNLDEQLTGRVNCQGLSLDLNALVSDAKLPWIARKLLNNKQLQLTTELDAKKGQINPFAEPDSKFKKKFQANPGSGLGNRLITGLINLGSHWVKPAIHHGKPAIRVLPGIYWKLPAEAKSQVGLTDQGNITLPTLLGRYSGELILPAAEQSALNLQLAKLNTATGLNQALANLLSQVKQALSNPETEAEGLFLLQQLPTAHLIEQLTENINLKENIKALAQLASQYPVCRHAAAELYSGLHNNGIILNDKEMMRLIKTFEKEGGDMTSLARLLKNRNQLQMAQNCLTRTLKNSPQNATAYLLQAELQWQRNQRDKALTSYSQASILGHAQATTSLEARLASSADSQQAAQAQLTLAAMKLHTAAAASKRGPFTEALKTLEDIAQANPAKLTPQAAEIKAASSLPAFELLVEQCLAASRQGCCETPDIATPAHLHLSQVKQALATHKPHGLSDQSCLQLAENLIYAREGLSQDLTLAQELLEPLQMQSDSARLQLTVIRFVLNQRAKQTEK